MQNVWENIHANREIQASSNTFGTHFNVTTFGESRDGGVGCAIDGCPPTIPIFEVEIQFYLDKRFMSLVLNRNYTYMAVARVRGLEGSDEVIS